MQLKIIIEINSIAVKFRYGKIQFPILCIVYLLCGVCQEWRLLSYVPFYNSFAAIGAQLRSLASFRAIERNRHWGRRLFSDPTKPFLQCSLIFYFTVRKTFTRRSSRQTQTLRFLLVAFFYMTQLEWKMAGVFNDISAIWPIRNDAGNGSGCVSWSYSLWIIILKIGINWARSRKKCLFIHSIRIIFFQY